MWSSGTVKTHHIRFYIGTAYAGQTIQAIETLDGVTFTDTDGTVLLEHPWPKPGTTYIGRPKRPKPSAMS